MEHERRRNMTPEMEHSKEEQVKPTPSPTNTDTSAGAELGPTLEETPS